MFECVSVGGCRGGHLLAITVCQRNKEKVKHVHFNLSAVYQIAIFVLICIRPPFVVPSAVHEHMTQGGRDTRGGEGGVCVCV